MCACVCRPISYLYNAHPNDASKDTSCDIPVHISPGSHECGESGRAIGRVQAFSFVAFKVQVYGFFLAGGATNPHPFVAKSRSRSLSPLAKPVCYHDRYNQHSCVPIPSPFTARFQDTLVADDVTTVLVPE